MRPIITLLALTLAGCESSGAVLIEEGSSTTTPRTEDGFTACPPPEDIEPCPDATGSANSEQCFQTDGAAWDYAWLVYLDHSEIENAPALRLQLTGEALGELRYIAEDEERWDVVIESYEVYAEALRACL